MLHDLRYALRALRHSPAFTAVVVITLALGIGANTAIFSVVHGVLLKPLPHRDGDRLIYLRQSTDGLGGENITFSVPEVRDLRTGVPSLSGIAEYSRSSGILRGDDGALRIRTGLITGNYFEIMGLATVVGRVTRPSDDGPGAAPVAVLTHDYWISHFGGDSGIVNQQIILDGRSVTVIGVLEPAPFFPDRIDMLLNMVNSDHHLSAQMVEGRSHRMTHVVARLTPEATVAQVKAEVDVAYGRMQTQFKEAYDPAARYRIGVISLHEVLGERARLTLWLLMGAAAFVLIISAANVANLTLMRGVPREHELAVRAALGAGVGRLRRLLLVENLVLAIAGAVLGVFIAVGGLGLLTSLVARYSPRANEIELDGVVLAFTLALSVAVALLLSLLAPLPGEGSLAPRILAGAQGTSGNPGRRRLQRALVIVQIAVTVVLLAGAGLLTRTIVRLAAVETGLRTEEVLTMQVTQLSRDEVRADPAAAVAARTRLGEIRREIAALPGVIDVGIGTLPLRRSGAVLDVKVEGQPPPAGATPRAELRTADPEYFRAAGVPLLHGREFATTDGEGGERGAGRVAIINHAFADRLFPGVDPIGRRIALFDVVEFAWGDWRRIVGVVANTRDEGLDAEPQPVMFLPSTIGGEFLIRTSGDPSALAAAATRIVRRIAPAALIENVMTVAQYKDRSISPRRLNAALMSSFGTLAVIIAAVGIAGVLAFSVSARTIEIGIRMSLGADRGRVERMILKEGGGLLAIGLVVGVVGAFAATRVMQGFLFGVEPHDPITFIAVVAMMTVIGVVACWIPAVRAARIDPAITMRT
jgi:putative ABC transport system permease protein